MFNLKLNFITFEYLILQFFIFYLHIEFGHYSMTYFFTIFVNYVFSASAIHFIIKGLSNLQQQRERATYKIRAPHNRIKDFIKLHKNFNTNTISGSFCYPKQQSINVGILIKQKHIRKNLTGVSNKLWSYFAPLLSCQFESNEAKAIKEK